MEIESIDLEDLGVSDFILDRLNEDYGPIRDALDLSAMGSDERAELHDVRFTSITFGPNNSINIEYEYDWSLYHGCKDISAAGTEQSSITGKYKDGTFEFTVIPAPRDRSTHEEF